MSYRLVTFYTALLIYTVYDLAWLAGLMLSYTRNDTSGELYFFCTTFVLDVPTLFVVQRTKRIGIFLFSFILLASLIMALLQGVLNGPTLLLWYVPKLIPLSAALWTKHGELPDRKLDVNRV